jgi:Right handed beta helix region
LQREVVLKMKHIHIRYPLCGMIFCLVAVFSFVDISLASTWRVERDGSGNFSLLQEAADAAASGDTILVGSGRYDEWQMYGNNTQYPARMIIESKDLVIIGENDGSTIIGPENPIGADEPDHHGIVLITENNLIIRDIHFSNLDGGILSWVGGSVNLFHCGFIDTNNSFLIAAGRGGIFGCNFRDSRVQRTIQVFSHFAEELVIAECEFEIFNLLNTHLAIAGTDATISDCNFIGGVVAMNIDRGSHAVIRNCSFSEGRFCFDVGVGAPEIEVVDCSISEFEAAIYSGYPASTFKMDTCIVTNVGAATLVAAHINQGYIRNCFLSKGDKGVVLYTSNLYGDKDLVKDVVTINDFDMRHNDWGTTDPDSIQAWIDDNNDDPEIDYRILWEPYIGQPVATEKKKLDSFKSMFR